MILDPFAASIAASLLSNVAPMSHRRRGSGDSVAEALGRRLRSPLPDTPSTSTSSRASITQGIHQDHAGIAAPVMDEAGKLRLQWRSLGKMTR